MLELYENIKKLRESKGLSQDELAELTGYTSRSSIAKIEKGLVDLPQTKIIAFANALEVAPSELMGWSEKPKTLAAHFDGDEYTDDELDEIRQFAEFVKNKRK